MNIAPSAFASYQPQFSHGHFSTHKINSTNCLKSLPPMSGSADTLAMLTCDESKIKRTHYPDDLSLVPLPKIIFIEPSAARFVLLFKSLSTLSHPREGSAASNFFNPIFLSLFSQQLFRVFQILDSDLYIVFSLQLLHTSFLERFTYNFSKINTP